MRTGLAVALIVAAVSPRQAAVSPRQAAVSPRQAAVSPRQAAVSPRQVAVSPRQTAPTDEALQLLRRGRHTEVIKTIARKGTSKGREAATRAVVAARAEMALGRLADARARLERATIAAPTDLRVRGELMKAAAAAGDAAALRDLVRRTFDLWGTDKTSHVDRADAGNLTAAALAARFSERWEEANTLFRAAAKADRRAVDANLEWGALFLEKHATDDAVTSFKEVLAVEPDNADAHAGLARAALERGYDEAQAAGEIAAALAVNPRHAGALALRGEISLDAEDFAGVAAAVAALRATNPNDAGAAWLAGAVALLTLDRPAYERERDRRLAVRPGDGDFFVQVAEALVRHRRYDEARTVAAEGMTHSARHPALLASLGNTLLRLGEEDDGLRALRRAWDRDPYNVRTFNLLNLFEKVIQPAYVIHETKHLRFRIEPAARPAIEAIVGPFLERTYERYVARYGFEPRGPIVFELYGKPEHFAVRTTGLPRLGVAGVCFGRVITSQAPTNGAFNWGMVLAHELAHVFALELSRSRAPRWLAEGLAETETARLRPEWRRAEELELFAAAKVGALSPIGDLSQDFVKARDVESASLAYMHAAVAVEWLEDKLGFAKLREALVAFGRGERGPAVLESISGSSVRALDAELSAALERRFAGYAKQFLPETTARWRARGGASLPPTSAEALAEDGLLRLERGERAAAEEALRLAAAAPAGKGSAAVRYLDATLALAGGQAGPAAAGFDALIADGLDGYDVRLRRALAAVKAGDGAAVESHLERAVLFAPKRIEPRALLAEALQVSGKKAARLGVLVDLLRVDPQEGALAKEVTLEGARVGRLDLVVEAGPIAAFIDPGDADVHAATARAWAATGKPTLAAEAFERALALAPANPAALHRQAAEIYDRLGDRARASGHRDRAARAAITSDPSRRPAAGTPAAPAPPR